MISKNAIKSLAISFAIIIILASFLIFFENGLQEEVKEKEEIVELDNQISPYTNQGLTVQVLRIRHRGLLDKMNTGWISFDTSWKQKPSFYHIIKVDDKESTSQGGVGINGQFFNCWDTIGMECRDKYFIPEEQETSDVTLSIVEITNFGLLGRKTSEVVKEEINVVYDYRTGRWAGSEDSYMDSDGYGHYLGDTFEVWFNIYQTDYDNDDIPYWTEVNILGTDPTIDDSELDPDEDGIPTSWEWKWNYDPFLWDDHKNLDPDIDGIQNIEEYRMRKYFADPYQPDIYVEVDFMQKKNAFDLDHVLHEESKQMIIERFSQHGINCYVDDGWPDGPVNGGGEMLPFMESMPLDIGGQSFRFYKHNFADERKGIFRYAFMANIHGYVTPFEDNQFDSINIGTGWDQSKRYVGLKILAPFAKRLRMHGIASGLLHELGHTMGLMPITFYGNDIVGPIGERYPNMPEEEYENYLENYHSVMNYKYIYGDKSLMDFSDGSNGPPYDQNDWELLYLAAFERDDIYYEETASIDYTFEDFEIVNDYPGVIIDGWEYDKNITKDNLEELKDIVKIKNTDANIQLFIKTQTEHEGERNVRVYAKPNTGSVYSQYALVAEGFFNEDEGKIKLYSFEENLQNVLKKA